MADNTKTFCHSNSENSAVIATFSYTLGRQFWQYSRSKDNEDNSRAGKRQKQRRKRTTFNSTQLAALDQLYEKTQYPDVFEKEELARRMNLREACVQITDLPSELLSLIFKEVVLSDGDTAYLKISLVCKKFKGIITKEGFKNGCHFDWLLSLKPKEFWDKHLDRFLPFDIRTCRSCGSVFKYEPSLYWGGHGIRGEFVGSYDSIPNPSFCCAFCEATEDNYNDSIE